MRFILGANIIGSSEAYVVQKGKVIFSPRNPWSLYFLLTVPPNPFETISESFDAVVATLP